MNEDLRTYEPDQHIAVRSHVLNERFGALSDDEFVRAIRRAVELYEDGSASGRSDAHRLDELVGIAGLAQLRAASILSPGKPHHRLPRLPMGRLRPHTPRLHEAAAPEVDWTPGRDVEGAYRVGHSANPHPADGMTASIDMGGGAFTTIPNPAAADSSIGWHLTYSDARSFALTAASIISSFEHLISGSIGEGEARRRLSLLRRAWRALSRTH